MAVLTIIKYTAISVEDAELSIGADQRGEETEHEAFVRKILSVTEDDGRETFTRKQKRDER